MIFGWCSSSVCVARHRADFFLWAVVVCCAAKEEVMELKLQLGDTARGGRTVLTSCLSCFSSAGRLVLLRFFFFFGQCRQEIRSKRKTTDKQKHARKVPKHPSKIHFNAVIFLLPKNKNGGPLWDCCHPEMEHRD